MVENNLSLNLGVLWLLASFAITLAAFTVLFRNAASVVVRDPNLWCNFEIIHFFLYASALDRFKNVSNMMKNATNLYSSLSNLRLAELACVWVAAAWRIENDTINWRAYSSWIITDPKCRSAEQNKKEDNVIKNEMHRANNTTYMCSEPKFKWLIVQSKEKIKRYYGQLLEPQPGWGRRLNRTVLPAPTSRHKAPCR